MIIRKSAEAFIYFSSSPVRLLLEVGALSIKRSKISGAYCFSISNMPRLFGWRCFD